MSHITITTLNKYLRNPEILEAFRTPIPPIDTVRLRSVNLNWRGPSLILRIDLPLDVEGASTPERPGSDVIQCQLQFLAVADLSLTDWKPPVFSAFTVNPEPDQRIHVVASGSEVHLEFSASNSVLVGHESSFQPGADGSDEGPHSFLRRLDAKLRDSIPNVSEKNFYGRV